MKSQIGNGCVTVRFDGKPPADVLSMLKAAGFRWQRFDKSWWRRRVTGAADLLTAIERRLNRDKPDGPCWDCKAPGGFFRPQGAATPVLCESCWQARNRPDVTDRLYEDDCARRCGL